MQTISVLTLPTLHFAHIHKADRYYNKLQTNTCGLEVTYLADGQLSLFHEDKEICLQAGDIIVSGHLPMLVSSQVSHVHHTVRARLDWQFCQDPDRLILPPVTRSCTSSKEITELIDRFIYRSYLYETAPEKAACDFLQILCKIDQCNREKEAVTLSSSSLLVQQAKKYIHRNLYHPITQQEIADYLQISPGYLCSIFRKEEHTTVIKYINTQKLLRIRSLMDTDHLKLYEAAALLGYSDPNYVSALYSKLFGQKITAPPSYSGQRSSTE